MIQWKIGRIPIHPHHESWIKKHNNSMEWFRVECLTRVANPASVAIGEIPLLVLHLNAFPALHHPLFERKPNHWWPIALFKNAFNHQFNLPYCLTFTVETCLWMCIQSSHQSTNNLFKPELNFLARWNQFKTLAAC